MMGLQDELAENTTGDTSSVTITTEDDLYNVILGELQTELSGEPLYNAAVLQNKVKDAIREMKRRRCYKNTSMTDEQIVEDMVEHFSIIKQAALVYYNRVGSEGERVHYENTVHRSFQYDDDLYSGVIAFIKVL